MKKTKIIIPAMGMLLLGTAASVTGTVAWFSMNSSVSLTGMQVKTAVSNNLLIDNYVGGEWATDDSTFASSKTQTINTNNVLAPMSTIDGKSFFYVDPSNVAGNGDASSESYIAYSDLATLQAKYPTAEAPYLDYHFVLKAENTSSSNACYINLTKCNLVYNGARDANKAFRVAVFSKKFTTATVNGSKTAPGLADAATSILVPGTAANYFESGKAVKTTSTTDSVLTLNTAANLATVAVSATEYYEVTIRLWLEGEDKTCTVGVFKELATGAWKLDLKMELANATGGVTSLGKYTTSVQSGANYYCDGTYAYKEVNGEIDTTALDATACAAIDAGLEANLESAFGITIG